MRKSGLELIAQERQKQITKHGFTGKWQAERPAYYETGQLLDVAKTMLNMDIVLRDHPTPLNWDPVWYTRLTEKPFDERVVIAGALIVAELDRLESIEEIKRWEISEETANKLVDALSGVRVSAEGFLMNMKEMLILSAEKSLRVAGTHYTDMRTKYDTANLFTRWYWKKEMDKAQAYFQNVKDGFAEVMTQIENETKINF